jgi:hypothetical protein
VCDAVSRTFPTRSSIERSWRIALDLIERSAGRNTNGQGGDSIVQTLAAICEPHAAAGSKESAANGRTHHSA